MPLCIYVRTCQCKQTAPATAAAQRQPPDSDINTDSALRLLSLGRGLQVIELRECDSIYSQHTRDPFALAL